MGFKDGTVNSNAHPPTNLDTVLWAGSEGPAWMHGGSYLVYRRIRMALEHWDRLAPTQQEQVIGRQKLDGAPLGETGEFDAIDLDQRRLQRAAWSSRPRRTCVWPRRRRTTAR
jgi:deferrochelatase/peroxidase EfeB